MSLGRGVISELVNEAWFLGEEIGAIYLERGMLQSGGKVLRDNTIKALNELFDVNLSRQEWSDAIHLLKHDNLIPNEVHGSISKIGEYWLDGVLKGNLGQYIK